MNRLNDDSGAVIAVTRTRRAPEDHSVDERSATAARAALTVITVRARGDKASRLFRITPA